MSNTLEGIGLRMLAIRKKHGFTQVVMAAKLDISDRTYNYYEQEKRELPTSVAIRFCNLFSVNLEWLLIGETRAISTGHLGIISDSVSAVLSENSERKTELSYEKLGKFVTNVVDRCTNGQGTPKEVAASLFGLVE